MRVGENFIDDLPDSGLANQVKVKLAEMPVKNRVVPDLALIQPMGRRRATVAGLCRNFTGVCGRTDFGVLLLIPMQTVQVTSFNDLDQVCALADF